jgi:hypothetical protein
MGIKKFVANALRGVVTVVEDRMHDAQAREYCGKCDRCLDRKITRNPLIPVIFTPPGKGIPTLLVGTRPKGHLRQLEVGSYYDPSASKQM